MKIILRGGKFEPNAMANILSEVAKGIKEKLPNTDKLDKAIEGTYLANVEFDFLFKVKGMDDLQQLSVNHHEDTSELLTVIVDIDENGNIANMKDNEKESNYTKEQTIIVDGVDTSKLVAVESVVNHDEVKTIETFERGGGCIKLYINNDGTVIKEWILDGVLYASGKVVLDSGADVLEDYLNTQRNKYKDYDNSITTYDKQ